MFINLNTGFIGVQANLEQTLAYAQKHGFGGIDFSDLPDDQVLAETAVAMKGMWEDAGV